MVSAGQTMVGSWMSVLLLRILFDFHPGLIPVGCAYVATGVFVSGEKSAGTERFGARGTWRLVRGTFKTLLATRANGPIREGTAAQGPRPRGTQPTYSDNASCGRWNGLSRDQKAADEILARLKLDVKALTLLYESDSDLRPVLEKSLLESQDDYVARFVSLLQSRRLQPDDRGNLPVALGELVLASFLTIVGLAAFVPVMAGLATPQQWVSYFSSASVPSFTQGPFYFGAPLLDFIFAAVLLLGAFYSLRRASRNLKNSGLILEPGRS